MISGVIRYPFGARFTFELAWAAALIGVARKVGLGQRDTPSSLTGMAYVNGLMYEGRRGFRDKRELDHCALASLDHIHCMQKVATVCF